MGSIFIERSLKNALDFFKEAVFSEDIARSGGLLQSLDARLKIFLLLISLLAAISANNIPILVGLYLLSIILAFASGINIVFFLKRVWFFIPIFTLVIAIPALFMNGPVPAAIFVLRVIACVSFAVLITITTRHSRLLRSLQSIGVPAIFIQVLDMSYRYIFLFMKTFEEMHLGLKSRLIRKLGARNARYWVASRISHLFKRSLKMSEEVYLAMVARGYTGEIRAKKGK